VRSLVVYLSSSSYNDIIISYYFIHDIRDNTLREVVTFLIEIL